MPRKGKAIPVEAHPQLTPLLTVEELAQLLSVPVGTLYKWRLKGTGPKAYRIGKHLRYDPHDLKAWLDSRAA